MTRNSKQEEMARNSGGSTSLGKFLNSETSQILRVFFKKNYKHRHKKDQLLLQIIHTFLNLCPSQGNKNTDIQKDGHNTKAYRQ